MRRTLAFAVAGVLACAVTVVPTRVDASARGDAAHEGAAWIAREQESDGGFFASGQRVDQTAEMLASMLAGGVDGRALKRAVGYMRTRAAAGASRGAYTGRIVAGLVAAGENPRSFDGTDFVAKLDEQYDESSGVYDTENLFTNLMGANGALAANQTLPAQAIAYIKDNACSAGGFGFENDCAAGPDVDTSAWVINVLVAAGQKSDPAVSSAKAYILSVQRSDGGFGFTKDKSTSADSTGLVLSAIEALGERSSKAPWRQDDGGDPVKALLKLQHSSGGFRFVAASKTPNALSTINAVPGLARIAYPIPKVDLSATPKPTPTRTPAPAQTPKPDGNGGSSGGGSTGGSTGGSSGGGALGGGAPRPPFTGGATTTATLPSPGAGPVASVPPTNGSGSAPQAAPGNTLSFTPQPDAPFDNTVAPPVATIPAGVLWAGLAGAAALAGGGVGGWLYLKRRGVTWPGIRGLRARWLGGR
jgi:uncharacterized membrane protein YgcG